jgi:hypothetical protein
MPSLVEKAIQSHLRTGKTPRVLKSIPERKENHVARRRKEVGELALKFFDVATNPDFGRLAGSVATAGLVKAFNKGEIITYHGPFALEYRRIKDQQLTIAKQVRLYDYRNGATKSGNPEIHIEAAILDGIVGDASFRVPGDYILSTIEIPRDLPEETVIEVRRAQDGYSPFGKIENPGDRAWDEVLDDLELAVDFLETGSVHTSSYENGVLVSSNP